IDGAVVLDGIARRQPAEIAKGLCKKLWINWFSPIQIFTRDFRFPPILLPMTLKPIDKCLWTKRKLCAKSRRLIINRQIGRALGKVAINASVTDGFIILVGADSV